jgi:hypothetical protein
VRKYARADSAVVRVVQYDRMPGAVARALHLADSILSNYSLKGNRLDDQAGKCHLMTETPFDMCDSTLQLCISPTSSNLCFCFSKFPSSTVILARSVPALAAPKSFQEGASPMASQIALRRS